MAVKAREIRQELFEHLPYTVLSVAGGLMILGLMTYAAMITAAPGSRSADGHRHDAESAAESGSPARGGEAKRAPALNPNFRPAAQIMFHVFHPLHTFFSAVATVAMFWRHERRWTKAILVGVFGAVGLCGISDIFLPYLAGLLLGVEGMQMHICLIEHPGVILPFLIAGLLLGLILPISTHKSTIFSHAAHVLVSSTASIMYLVAFGLENWIESIGMVFVYMVFAVILPCCASDILFPLLLTSKGGGCPADSHEAHND
jgi:hypothetical protein